MIARCTIQPLACARLAEAQALLAASCAFDAAAEVAEEKLFGPALHHAAHPLAAWRHGRLAGVAVASGPWLRLLAVHPDHRGHGLGTALLHAAEQRIIRHITRSTPRQTPRAALPAGATANASAPVIRVLDQPGNYLAPGVDLRNAEAIAWLERRGYEQHGQRTNLLVSLRGNPRVEPAHARALVAACPDYDLRRAGSADRPALLAMIEDAFGAGWAFEAGRAMDRDPPGVHLAVHRHSRDIAAFAAHDGNNRGLGWFGPTGTREEHRGRGLGAALLVACLLDVAATGREICEIAWIGPRNFYDRTVGIAGERCFAVMRRRLPQPDAHDAQPDARPDAQPDAHDAHPDAGDPSAQSPQSPQSPHDPHNQELEAS